MTPKQWKVWNERLTPLQRRYAVAWWHFGWIMNDSTLEVTRRSATEILEIASIKPHKNRNSLKRCANAMLTRNNGAFAAFLEDVHYTQTEWREAALLYGPHPFGFGRSNPWKLWILTRAPFPDRGKVTDP